MDPPGETSAAIFSVTSRSRSVALKARLRAVGLDQHVGQDRDRVAPLHHAMYVAKGFQQIRAFNRDLHGQTPLNPGSPGGHRKWLVAGDFARASTPAQAAYPMASAAAHRAGSHFRPPGQPGMVRGWVQSQSVAGKPAESPVFSTAVADRRMLFLIVCNPMRHVPKTAALVASMRLRDVDPRITGAGTA